MRDAIEHLFARYRAIRPLFRAEARPMKDEWKIRPYFGVFPRVFNALETKFHESYENLKAIRKYLNGKYIISQSKETV